MQTDGERRKRRMKVPAPVAVGSKSVKKSHRKHLREVSDYV